MHLLNVGGSAALVAKDGRMAVSFYERYLKAAQKNRKMEPADANYQVSEVLAHMLLGDAYMLDGRRKTAIEAYRAAERLSAVAGADPRELLEMQDIRTKLKVRLGGAR